MTTKLSICFFTEDTDYKDIFKIDKQTKTIDFEGQKLGHQDAELEAAMNIGGETRRGPVILAYRKYRNEQFKLFLQYADGELVYKRNERVGIYAPYENRSKFRIKFNLNCQTVIIPETTYGFCRFKKDVYSFLGLSVDEVRNLMSGIYVTTLTREIDALISRKNGWISSYYGPDHEVVSIRKLSIHDICRERLRRVLEELEDAGLDEAELGRRKRVFCRLFSFPPIPGTRF